MNPKLKEYSKVLSPAGTKRIIRNHQGTVSVEVSVVHDYVDVEIPKTKAYKLVQVAEEDNLNFHVIFTGKDLHLIFCEDPAEDE